MDTKFNTGDIVYAPVQIQSARVFRGEILYTVSYPESGKEIDSLLPESKIMTKEQLIGEAYVKVIPEVSEVNIAIGKAKEFYDTMEKAMKLADSIANKDLNVRLLTELNGKTTELAHISAE